jgi:hypothetical protein
MEDRIEPFSLEKEIELLPVGEIFHNKFPEENGVSEACRQVVIYDDLVAAFAQGPHHMTAYVSCAACDKQFQFMHDNLPLPRGTVRLIPHDESKPLLDESPYP